MKIVRAVAPDSRVFRPIGGGRVHITGQAQAVKALATQIVPSAPPAIKSTSAYSASLVSRLTEDWPIAILSADAATRWSLRQLRARARDLERNGGIHNAYLDCLEVDIIGSKGIGVHLKIQDEGGDRVIPPAEHAFYKALNEGVATYRGLAAKRRLAFRQEAHHCAMKAAVVRTAHQLAPEETAIPGGGLDRYACYLVESEFKEFGKQGHCDVTGKHSLQDLCRLALRTAARDGDAVILAYLGYPNRWGVAFQLIEGDYVDDYYNVERLPNGHRIQMGVELNAFGRKVALWVFARHPGDYGTDGVTQTGTRRRIPILGEPPDPYYSPDGPEAVQAIHLTRSKRAEETRAVPWITPALQLIHHIESYKEAEITAAREEACKHVFYERDMFASDGTALEWEERDGKLTDEMQPGGATALPPGYKVNFVDPKHPNQHFPDFLKSMKREVAMAVNYCYNILFGDLESVNFSSIRAGLQNQREGSKMGQAWFGSNAFTPIFETFLKMALLTGALPFRTTDFPRLNRLELKFRRWPWVDPKSDAETAQLLIQMKLTTRGRVIADMSSDDFEDIIDELDDEAAYIATKKNLPPELLPPQPNGAPGQPAPAPEKTPAAAKKPAIKSAFLGETPFAELPEHAQRTIAEFVPSPAPEAKVIRYQMTVPELLAKADPHNLQTARRRVAKRTIASSAAEVLERKDKAILLLNDKLIDGHHHLAKAEKGKITSSLPVLDLTPLRYQPAAS
jgi:lambda family phage portal protein